MLSLDPPEVVEGWSSILWYTVVWPGGEVVLDHLTRGTALTGMLKMITDSQVVRYYDFMTLACHKT